MIDRFKEKRTTEKTEILVPLVQDKKYKSGTKT